jgi:poly-gamma-glutamate capsule biosynthesis protein CapA/YwtB (metallophosphatase superfamily)
MTIRQNLFRFVLLSGLLGISLTALPSRSGTGASGQTSRAPLPAKFLPQVTAATAPLKLIAVGDICLARGVEGEMVRRGRGYPFAALKKTLREADITFGNLECCLAFGGEPVPKKYNFRGHPRGAMALAEAGFDVVSLANNHSLDYGKQALADTIDNLKDQGILPSGGGKSLEEAHAVQIMEVRGVRVGFLSYLGLFPAALPLRDHEAGVAMAKLDLITRDVRAAKQQVDLLIVSMHAGKEYRFQHSSRQAEIAHTAVDAGADIVIGHHPHVVQDTEIYQGKPILYSLGNFVFDPSPTFLRDRGMRWSAMAMIEYTPGKPVSARLVDLRIVDRQPRIAGRGE